MSYYFGSVHNFKADQKQQLKLRKWKPAAWKGLTPTGYQVVPSEVNGLIHGSEGDKKVNEIISHPRKTKKPTSAHYGAAATVKLLSKI